MRERSLTVRSSIITSWPTFSSCNQISKYVLANMLQARCLFGNEKIYLTKLRPSSFHYNLKCTGKKKIFIQQTKNV